MLKLIYGSPGSGKTYLCDSLILKELSDGKRVTLIIPEQEAVDTENRIYDRAQSENIATEKLSVVSFRRLANLAFRKYGGICYGNIGDGGRLIILWRIMEELSPALKTYKNNRDRTLTELMLRVCTELKRYCVSPLSLSNAADGIQSPHLKNKLDDISLIYSAFLARTSEESYDSTDDINRLAEIYKKEKLNGDELFFIDSFNGFTYPELNVIESIMKYCSLTVTLNKPEKTGQTGYRTVENTETQLISLAEKNKVQIKTEAVLSDDNAFSGEHFRLIKNRLFDFSYGSENNYSSDKVTLAVCEDAFAQAEFIAFNICKLVRNGARYRDIAIISRNTDSYEGVIDAVFEKYGIPVFLSSRSKLTETSIYKTVTAALKIISDGFQTEDVLTYIKTGICGFDAREIDLIETYVSLWNINGSRWTDEYDWIMNPAGFTDITDQETAGLLYEINNIRKKITVPLTELSENIKNSDIKNACASVFGFIRKSGAYDFFRKTENREEITSYNTFIDTLDILEKTAGDIPVNASVFSSLLYLMAKNTDYGKIPSTFDRVTAGDASVLRCNGIKHVFLTDCENGKFPATAEDDSFFSYKEKEYLAERGIELSPDITEKNDCEMFYFLRSACGASETLTATLCLSNGKTYPSVGFQRLCALFPGNKIFSYPDDFPPTEQIQSFVTLRETIPVLIRSGYKNMTDKLCSEFSIPKERLNIPISVPETQIKPETISEIFGKKVNLSSSRLETYIKCPFSYYCKYVLKLKEKKYGFFGAADMGNYIHRILEKSINELFSGDINQKNDSDAEKAALSAISEVLNTILGGNVSDESKRLEALISRLSRTVILIVTNILHEFKNSKFRPKFFELRISDEKGKITPLKVSLNDGSTISVYGTIDRLDTYLSGESLYVRVVDYKTGSTPHSLSNLKYGLDMQMLLYLFSVCKSDEKDLKLLLGGDENSEIIPAGVLYQSARLQITKTATPQSYEKALEFANRTLIRSGIINNSPEVLSAMETGLKGNFIPVKDGETKTEKKFMVSQEDFEELYTTVENVLKETGNKMKSGYACALPLEHPNQNPCDYCSLYPICRNRQK